MTNDELKQTKRPQHPTTSQLTVYGDGKGTDSFRTAVAKHLQTCTTCAELFALVQQANTQNVRSLETVRSDIESVSNKPAPNELPVELVDHPQYAVEREIGRGGMGIVYLVKHKLTGRQEALKVLMPSLVEREDVRVRFLREIQSAASLDHPNICRTLNAFNDGRVLGLVMEFLPGNDLALFVKKHGAIPIRTACSLAIQLCSGLQHAHEKGMIHRDIKPGNLMIDKTQKGLRLKILDFGLARGMMDESPEQKSLTVDGRVLGTPEFMSPEQALTPSNVDIRSDLYSVGCVLYFMLSGRAPFQGETMLSILQSHIGKQAVALTALNPQVPESLWAIVSLLLEKDRAQRPSSPADVARLLTPFLTSNGTAPGVLPAVESNSSNNQSADRPADSVVEPIRFTPRRPIRKQKQPSSIVKLIPIFLPTLLLLGGTYYFKSQILGYWKELTGPPASYIVLNEMPADYEVLIDDQKANFMRPDARAAAQIFAPPGTYKLTLKKHDEVKFSKTVTVKAGQNVLLNVGPELVATKPVDTTTEADTREDQSGSRQSGSNTVADESSRETVSTALPTAEEIQLAIAGAKQAIRSRDGTAAKAALAPMFNSWGKLRIEEPQANSDLIRQLEKFSSALSDFKQKLESSCTKRQPNESVYMGQVRCTFLGATEGKLSLQRDNETLQLKTSELPCEIEQCLVDLELEDDVQQYSKLIKAVGLLTHPTKTQRDFELAIKWIQSAVEANFITDQFEVLAREFSEVVPEDSEVAPRLRAYTFQRRLSGAEGEIEKLFLLPANVLFQKQASLLASVLSKNFRGSTETPIWNVSTGEVVQQKAITSPLWACEVSGNGRIMVTFGETSPQTNLRIYKLPLANPWIQRSELDDERSEISLSADGRLLAACSADEMFIRWNLATESVQSKVVSKTPIGRDKLVATAIRPNLDLVAVAAKDGSVRTWKTTDGSESSIAKDVASPVKAMQFNRKGDRLVVVREDGTVELRELGLNLVQSFRSHSAPLTSLGFSAKGRYLVTADCFNNVRVWDTDDLKIEAAFNVDDSSEITAVTVDGEGDLVAIGHKDSAIEVWRKK